MLIKQKEDIRTPKDKLHNALLTLKFLNASESGTTADERHWTIGKKTAELNMTVYNKDAMRSSWRMGKLLQWG